VKALRSVQRGDSVPHWAVPPVRPVARPAVVAAVAASDRLRFGLAGEWRQREVAPDRLAVGGADLLLVEISDGAVPGFGAVDGPEVVGLVAEAARHDVPVVVWATSGRPPVGADVLAEAAEQFFVADRLDDWRATVPGAQELPPAASPRVHNPGAGPGERRPARAVVLTSGPVDPTLSGAVSTVLARGVAPLERAVDVHRLDDEVPVRAVLPSALRDRLRESGRGGAYAGAVASVNHARVLVDGARRSPGDTWAVLEAGAAQTAVVSLPEGPGDPRDLRAEVVARLHQTELRDREALVLHREVLVGHTYSHRVDQILGSQILGGQILGGPTTSRSVSAIVPTNRAHEIDNVLANVGRQAHDDLELVLVLHGLDPSDPDLSETDLSEAGLRKRAAEHGVPHLTLLEADSTLTLGACLNLGVDASSGTYIAKMDDDNFYGRHYLTDLLNAFTSSGAGIVGKWAHYVQLSTGAVVLRYPDAEHTWQRRIQGGSMLFEADVARSLRFGDLPRAVDSDILDRAIAEGVKIWSADRFNYVSVRGGDRTAHTWTVSDASFLTESGRLAFYGDPRAHVEV
jgi:hypothetical protein